MIEKSAQPFWRTKSLTEMTAEEWESLCDGCGRCCLVKLEEDLDPEPGDAIPPQSRPPNPRIFYTDVGCRLLDAGACRCRNYAGRTAQVADCVRLTPEAVADIGWLPPTCGYRLVQEGRDLPAWHPLVSGDPETVHSAGVSVRGQVVADEDTVPADSLENHIVSWPLRWPGGRRAAPSRLRRPKRGG